jgi:hypothetical protein
MERMGRPKDMNMEVAKIAYFLFLMMMMMMMGRKWPDMMCICIIYIGNDRNKKKQLDRYSYATGDIAVATFTKNIT